MNYILRLIGIYYAVIFNAIIPAILFKLSGTYFLEGEYKAALGFGAVALVFTLWCVYLGLSSRKNYLEKIEKRNKE